MMSGSLPYKTAPCHGRCQLIGRQVAQTGLSSQLCSSTALARKGQGALSAPFNILCPWKHPRKCRFTHNMRANAAEALCNSVHTYNVYSGSVLQVW